jgi:hypothetical protein
MHGQACAFTVEECVPSFSPLTERGQAGCCTVTVGDDPTSRGDYDDLQEAVDSLTGPGRVCVLPGEPKKMNWSKYRSICATWRQDYNKTHGTSHGITDRIP